MTPGYRFSVDFTLDQRKTGKSIAPTGSCIFWGLGKNVPVNYTKIGVKIKRCEGCSPPQTVVLYSRMSIEKHRLTEKMGNLRTVVDLIV